MHFSRKQTSNLLKINKNPLANKFALSESLTQTKSQPFVVSLNTRKEKFQLPAEFIKKYDPIRGGRQQPQFGFNGVGELAYLRSYSRAREDGRQEKWFETVERVVNGAFTMQLRHANLSNLKWDQDKKLELAQKMYDRIFSLKFLPPGRGLWAMGTKITEERSLYTALNNCAFVSTQQEDVNRFIGSFTFLMDASMLGVGVGFDTKGAGMHKIHKPNPNKKKRFTIPDSREGWVESLQLLMESYFRPNELEYDFDYSAIRKPGIPLLTFGGTSSGAGPLIELHRVLRDMFERRMNSSLTSRDIVDIMNLLGKCVISGNIRRVAEIALGDAYDKDFIALKDYEKNPDRAEYGWVSNNSIYAEIGMDYTTIADKIRLNGEPGLCWLDNMRAYGRMAEAPNYRDKLAAGGNPCLEQTLESHEMCCLVETFPNEHKTYDDYQETLQMAFLYAKSVTLGLPHWKDSQDVMGRNRRIGTSISGVAQFVGEKGLGALTQWCDKGYNYLKEYDQYLSQVDMKVPESIKITSIKPSGTVSLLAGATPGIHFPTSQNYIRRIRVQKKSPLIEPLARAGYFIEDDKMDDSSLVVEFPVSLGDKIRTLKEVTLWEQLQMASYMQRFWADNQVSCTVTFEPETEGKDIKNALDYFQYSLKGISFLPSFKDVYPQMPYEEISAEEYHRRQEKLKPLQVNPENLSFDGKDPTAEQFCDGDKCVL